MAGGNAGHSFLPSVVALIYSTPLFGDSRCRNRIAELETVDHVHAANHAAERGEVALVVRLRRDAKGVARTARIEARRGPAQIPSRQTPATDLVAQRERVADRSLLRDEVRHQATELGADDGAGLDERSTK